MGRRKDQEEPFPFLSPNVAEALDAYNVALEIVDSAKAIDAIPSDVVLAQTAALAYANVVIARMRLELERDARNDFRQSLCAHGFRPVPDPTGTPALVMWQCDKCGRYEQRVRSQTTPCRFNAHDWVRIRFDGVKPTADFSVICSKCGTASPGGPS